MTGERTPILYDADCGFCRASLALVLLWDRRRALRPVALQDEEADRLLANMSPERKMASWHLVDEAGVHSAGEAVVPLTQALPGGGPPGRVAEQVPAMTERAYRWVADHRSALGRLVPAALADRATRLIKARS